MREWKQAQIDEMDQTEQMLKKYSIYVVWFCSFIVSV